VTQPAMSQSWSQSPAPRFRRPHLVAALARPRLSSSACWSVAGRRCPSLDGVAADMVLGDLSDEAALNAWSTGADASSTPPASSRRAGRRFMAVNRDGTAACRRWPRRPLPASVLAGRARTAALALCREQARGGGGGRRPIGTLAHGPGAGRLRPRRPRDAGLLSRRSPAVSRRSPRWPMPAVADPCRRPRRGAGARPRPPPPPVDLRNR
jgi:hypothetical protein